jgi:hypothetical protein
MLSSSCKIQRARIAQSIVAKRFEVLGAVKKSAVFFWVVTTCGVVGGYQS